MGATFAVGEGPGLPLKEQRPEIDLRDLDGGERRLVRHVRTGTGRGGGAVLVGVRPNGVSNTTAGLATV